MVEGGVVVVMVVVVRVGGGGGEIVGDGAVGAVEDGEIAELCALERVALLRDGDEEALDEAPCAGEDAGGGGVVGRVDDLDDDVQRLVEDVLPAGLAADVGLLVLADGALSADHDAAGGVALEALERGAARAEQTADKVVVRVLLGGDAQLDALALRRGRDGRGGMAKALDLLLQDAPRVRDGGLEGLQHLGLAHEVLQTGGGRWARHGIGGRVGGRRSWEGWRAGRG